MTLTHKYNRIVRRAPFLTINLGHILIISTWIAAALVTYGTISQQMISFDKRITTLESMCTRYGAIETDISWIKRTLEKRNP